MVLYLWLLNVPGPQVAEGENVFGVCHIFASFNDTFAQVTDLSRKPSAE